MEAKTVGILMFVSLILSGTAIGIAIVPGPQGPMGEQGEQGLPGIQGPTGQNDAFISGYAQLYCGPGGHLKWIVHLINLGDETAFNIVTQIKIYNRQGFIAEISFHTLSLEAMSSLIKTGNTDIDCPRLQNEIPGYTLRFQWD